MFKAKGFSLIELLVSISILAIALSYALPGFSRLAEDQRLQTATQELHSAMSQARETAVLSGRPISVAAQNGDWAQGWNLFYDSNNNGIREPSEQLLSTHEALVRITAHPDPTSRDYVHYTPRGQSIQPSGAFHSGHILLCASTHSAARIVINKAGRIRRETNATALPCAN